MSETAIEKVVDVIAERIGGPVTCPLCGHDGWRSLGGLFFVLPTGVVLDSGEEALTHGVLGLACGNCTYVRLHDALPTEE